MGLQGQLNDVASDSIPILVVALIATSVNHLLSFLTYFCHSVGVSHGRVLPPPATVDLVLSEQLSVNSHNSHRHRRSNGGGEEEGCVVCLNGFEDGEFIRRLSCNHVFHKDCLDRWIDQMKFSCPLCRSALVSDCRVVDRAHRRVAGQLAAWFTAVR